MKKYILSSEDLRGNGIPCTDGVRLWAHDWVWELGNMNVRIYKFLLNNLDIRYVKVFFNYLIEEHPYFVLPEDSDQWERDAFSAAKKRKAAAEERKAAAEERKAAAAKKAVEEKAAAEKAAAAKKAAEKAAAAKKAAEEKAAAFLAAAAAQKRCSISGCFNYLKINAPPTASLCKVHRPPRKPRRAIPKPCEHRCSDCGNWYFDYQEGYGWCCSCDSPCGCW